MFSRPFIGFVLSTLFVFMLFSIGTNFSGCQDDTVHPPEYYGEPLFDLTDADTGIVLMTYKFPVGYYIDTVYGRVSFTQPDAIPIEQSFGYCLVVHYNDQIVPFYYLSTGYNVTSELARFDAIPSIGKHNLKLLLLDDGTPLELPEPDTVNQQPPQRKRKPIRAKDRDY